MDIIGLTRQLGAAIQKEEAYINFHKAKEINEADDELNELINKIQLIHMSYQHEANKDDANMQAFEKAKEELDAMMKEITGILSLCAQGEDPEKCEYAPACSGNCASCGGGCAQ